MEVMAEPMTSSQEKKVKPSFSKQRSSALIESEGKVKELEELLEHQIKKVE